MKSKQPAVTDEPGGARETQQVDPGTEPTIWTVTVDYDTRQDLSHSWTSQRSADLQPDLADESMVDKAMCKSHLVAANLYGAFSIVDHYFLTEQKQFYREKHKQQDVGKYFYLVFVLT